MSNKINAYVSCKFHPLSRVHCCSLVNGLEEQVTELVAALENITVVSEHTGDIYDELAEVAKIAKSALAKEQNEQS